MREMEAAYELLKQENERNKESFLQACRTLAHIEEMLEIPEDESTGDPEEIYEAMSELMADAKIGRLVRNNLKADIGLVPMATIITKKEVEALDASRPQPTVTLPTNEST
jgi:hypothetical protein